MGGLGLDMRLVPTHFGGAFAVPRVPCGKDSVKKRSTKGHTTIVRCTKYVPWFSVCTPADFPISVNKRGKNAANKCATIRRTDHHTRVRVDENHLPRVQQ